MMVVISFNGKTRCVEVGEGGIGDKGYISEQA
jgi:hypothetical protein